MCSSDSRTRFLLLLLPHLLLELPAAEAHIDGMAATAATERGFGHSTPDPADADPVAGSHTNRGAPKPRAQLASAIAKLYSLLALFHYFFTIRVTTPYQVQYGTETYLMV